MKSMAHLVSFNNCTVKTASKRKQSEKALPVLTFSPKETLDSQGQETIFGQLQTLVPQPKRKFTEHSM
jgi:hypothetical protein